METTPTITVPIHLPEKFIEETAAAITELVMANVEKRFRFSELPEYPTKNEIKKILKIGDDRLNEWIADGLPRVSCFGSKTRFDREDIKKYINNTKTSY